MKPINILYKKFFSKEKKSTYQKFDTFSGVFTPNVLTILGVIMYLRMGWVVGNAGFIGSVAIILLAKTVTIFTGLSMSSITTNIKIGAGGAYSIITKSLGLEAGGSIGIPLYIAQTLSIALYIVGFSEGWIRIFPDHSYIVVATIVWAAVLSISYISARFAIKIQFVIMAIIALSLISFFGTKVDFISNTNSLGNFEDASFWVVFAVFFPAVTGIMAGANMSGDLKNPRKSIPYGTLLAVIITGIIYIALAWMLAKTGSSSELRENQMFMVDKALWGPLVLAGILGATFSSALGSMLGAPRILQALSKQKTIPFYKILAKKTKNNEPRNALILTAIIVEVSLFIGDLNTLASLITMFFLITYGMLNLVVFIQQSMKIISFRPTFKIPRAISFIGALQCIFIMFLIDAVFSVIAIFIIISLYIYLARRELKADFGDVRGGMFLALAERAARIAVKFPRHQISWKPDLLLPVEEPKLWAGPLLFIKNLCSPSGSVFAVTIKNNPDNEIEDELNKLVVPLKEEGLLTNTAIISDDSFLHGTGIVMQTLKNFAFRPNLLFLTIGEEAKNDESINKLYDQARNNNLGVVILRQHSRVAFGMQKDVNLWLRDQSPNWHLAVLLSLQLQLNWGGKINLISVASEEKDIKSLNSFLERLSDLARLPSLTEFHVLHGSFKNSLQEAPKADINIFGLSGKNIPFEFIREIPSLANTSCLFVLDSGNENALV